MADYVAMARRVLEEAFDEGNLAVLDEICGDGFVDHDPLMGDQDKEAAKRTIASYREAFPDLHITVDDAIAAGDKVVLRWHGDGTFENPLLGLEPTGERGRTVRGISIDRFEGDKVVESWTQWDTLTFMQDIGAIPHAAGASA